MQNSGPRGSMVDQEACNGIYHPLGSVTRGGPDFVQNRETDKLVNLSTTRWYRCSCLVMAVQLPMPIPASRLGRIQG